MKIIQSKVFVLESKENVSQSKVFVMDRLNVSVHFYFIKIVTFFVLNPLKEYNSKKKVTFKNSVSRFHFLRENPYNYREARRNISICSGVYRKSICHHLSTFYKFYII